MMDWTKRRFLNYALLPLSGIFFALSSLRRWCYKMRILPSFGFDVPVIVVGNITAGGAGKTPVVVALAHIFSNLGKKVGVVSRGFRRENGRENLQVLKNTDVADSGDEALLMARSTDAVVIVNRCRVCAVRELIDHHQVDIILSDDGLQHYALRPKISIAVIGKTGFGNGFLLPAGPLRESVWRLKNFDFVLQNGNPADFVIQPEATLNLKTGEKIALEKWSGRKIHAVAGIGVPQNFFQMLKKIGAQIIAHPFPDHHPYQAEDLDFGDDYPILMTAKDAVKCEKFATEKMWFVSASAILGSEFTARLKRAL